MKKLFLLSLLFVTIITLGQNIVHIQYRYVASENVAEFETLETEHWSKIKKNAIENGNMLVSAFFRVHGRTDDETKPTHAFVQVFKSFEQYEGQMKIWNNTEQILGFNPAFASTNDISKTLYNDTYKLVAELPMGEFKYAVWNLAKPKDFNGFVNENLNLWMPYFKKNLGKDGARTGWGILARVHPKGMDESSIITYDHYKDLSSALSSLSPMDAAADKEVNEILSKSKMNKYNPEGFRYTNIWELIELIGGPQ
ncbi:hypothetical protein N9473_00980 [Polaribacter sp.]|nr:hypothetical protein [Polaribacter sp.]MDB4098751.1 hypothetical protein [Polaribacter sp.]MDC1237974.1 hypothetical protein [Polaribacter sp.]